jgi:GDP-mannose 6-dehydrogenase
MRVSVFGLGYVGAVSCGCLGRDGHEVVGVDVNPEKVRLINQRQSPIVEAEVGDLIAHAVGHGRLRATTDVAEAVRATEVSVISVGTPSSPSGAIDLQALERVCEAIGRALADKSERHLVVVRSTVLPGTVRSLCIPRLEASSGKRHGADFGVCFHPEFLRESTSVRDYYDPPFTLIGSDGRIDGQQAALLYPGLAGEVIHTAVETAEMVKYVCNAFHALKITFANEVGALARTLGVDSHEVMEIACRDTKLNISPRYLRPGFAFGGSCLPKDVRALVHKAREHDLELPVLRGMLTSNQLLVERAIQLVLSLRKRKVGMLGLAFKAGTDDLRESPLVALSEALIGKGFDLRIYDRNVNLARLVGANKEHIERELPHLSSILGDDLGAVVAHAEVLVVGNAAPELRALPSLCRDGQVVVDLVRLDGFAQRPGVAYRGITW